MRDAGMQLMDVKKVSEMLSVKPSTIYQRAELGQIPCIKLNGALRFDPEDVSKWIQACKKHPAAEYNLFARTIQRPRKGGKE